MITKLFRRLIARHLIRRGTRLMTRYMDACEEIASNPWLAEQVCPSLKFLRRHAMACAKLARKLRTSNV